MAIVTLGELLHRKAGGAISAQNPLQVRQFDGSGNAISPATETTLGAVKTAIDKLTALIDSDALKVALTGSEVERAKLTTPMTVSPGSLVSALEDIPVRGSKIFVNVKTPTSEPAHDFEIHIIHRWAEVTGTLFTVQIDSHIVQNSQVGVVKLEVISPHVSVRIRNMSDEAHNYVVYLGALP